MQLSRLQDFTTDVAEMRVLKESFLKQARELAASMLACAKNTNEHETWKEVAHKLKGSAANFGAHRLSSLCRQAQHTNSDALAKKCRLAESIVKETEIVRAYLEAQLGYSSSSSLPLPTPRLARSALESDR